MAVAYPFAYPLELDASNKLSKIKVKNLYSNVDTGANSIGRPLMMGDETIEMGELNRFKREVL
jgi:hypothetical protein